MTRIRHIEVATVELPCMFPIRSTLRSVSHVVNVLVVIHTDDGLTGSSYVAGFTRHQARAVRAMVDELGPCINGLSVTDTGVALARMQQACRLLGRGGIGSSALSALDVAMWDAKAKALDAPLHALLGTAQRDLRTYASDGCWIAEDPSQTATEAADFVAAGFRAVKVRVGRDDAGDDLNVVDEVRAAVGNDVDLLVDANQGWDFHLARRMGRELTERGIDWLEEPVPADDINALTHLQQELVLRVVAGESVYMPRGIQELVQARAVSVVMPDVQRIGGVTGWIQASAIASVAGVQVSSHLFPEVSAHLLAATPNGGPLEHVSWMEQFLIEPLEMRNGAVTVPSKPGVGLEFDWGQLKEHIID